MKVSQSKERHLFPRNFSDSKEGTILLWTIGVFAVSLLVLATVFSLASYFSGQIELQSKLELFLTNSSENLDFDAFYLSGNPRDVEFNSDLVLASVLKDFRRIPKYRNIKVVRWESTGQELWVQVSCPWDSPLGSFEILPESMTANVHLKMDSNRQLQ